MRQIPRLHRIKPAITADTDAFQKPFNIVFTGIRKELQKPQPIRFALGHALHQALIPGIHGKNILLGNLPIRASLAPGVDNRFTFGVRYFHFF